MPSSLGDADGREAMTPDHPLQHLHHDGGAPALHIINQNLGDCEVSSAITPLLTGGGRGSCDRTSLVMASGEMRTRRS